LIGATHQPRKEAKALLPIRISLWAGLNREELQQAIASAITENLGSQNDALINALTDIIDRNNQAVTRAIIGVLNTIQEPIVQADTELKRRLDALESELQQLRNSADSERE
jgi:RNase P/RNase MRP subunit POP5